MKPKNHHRRNFLKTGATVGAGSIAAPQLLLGQEAGANNRVNVAAIGALGKGLSDWGSTLKEGNNIVALCDVDKKRLDEAAVKFKEVATELGFPDAPAPKLYQDYRVMLEEMDSEIEAVTISTPDHTHFPSAMSAIAAGKHVMVQKPICNNIWEVRELHKTAKAAGIVTQMGNQGRTMEGQRLVKEWIEQGAIGTLKEIKLWTNRPIWAQGDLQKTEKPVPEGLDWDIWQSITEDKPYFEFSPGHEHWGNTVHPFNWRSWWDYGSGALGDMGCHIMDATFSVLGQAIPQKIEAECSGIYAECAPAWSRLKYHFAAAENYPDLVVSWHDGSLEDGSPNKPEIPEQMAATPIGKSAFDKATSGMLFIGTDGVIFEGEAYCERPMIYPLDKFADVRKAMKAGDIKKTEKRSTHPSEPQQEWAHAIKNGLETTSNFDYAAPLTEFVLLGNLAIRANKTVSWDKAAMSTGDAEADAFIKRPSYRDGWMPPLAGATAPAEEAAPEKEAATAS